MISRFEFIDRFGYCKNLVKEGYIDKNYHLTDKLMFYLRKLKNMFLRISENRVINSDWIGEIIKEEFGLRIILRNNQYYFLSLPGSEKYINVILSYINREEYRG